MDEAALFLNGGEGFGVADVRGGGVVVVVAPFRKVVCELEAGGIARGVFEVNDDELLVRVGWQEEWGLGGGEEAEDVAVLSLALVSAVFKTIGLELGRDE